MNDMCKKSINMLWIIAHDQKSTLLYLAKLGNLTSITTNQPNLVTYARQPRLPKLGGLD
jgi:hypothetical protein